MKTKLQFIFLLCSLLTYADLAGIDYVVNKPSINDHMFITILFILLCLVNICSFLTAIIIAIRNRYWSQHIEYCLAVFLSSTGSALSLFALIPSLRELLKTGLFK